MTLQRTIVTLAITAITAGIFGMSATAATAVPEKCPPGQTMTDAREQDA